MYKILHRLLKANKIHRICVRPGVSPPPSDAGIWLKSRHFRATYRLPSSILRPVWKSTKTSQPAEMLEIINDREVRRYRMRSYQQEPFVEKRCHNLHLMEILLPHSGGYYRFQHVFIAKYWYIFLARALLQLLHRLYRIIMTGFWREVKHFYLLSIHSLTTF